MKETDLFDPIRQYLEAQGYSVHSEVRHCDLVARMGDKIIIIELKTQMSLKLIMQAVQRQELNPNVYLALPLKQASAYPTNYIDFKRLLRRLGLGLMFVRFLKTKTKIEIAMHPGKASAFQRSKQLEMIIREIDGRYAEFNTAGEPSTTEKLTAYKQQSIAIAHKLAENGPSSPSQLRSLGTSLKTQRILAANVYGWFDRHRRGVYGLNNAGMTALENYSQIIERMGLGSCEASTDDQRHRLKEDDG